VVMLPATNTTQTKKISINQCEIFNFGGQFVVNIIQTRVKDATAVIFSVKCFNPLKLHRLSENMLRKPLDSYLLFIHENLIKY